MSGNKGGEEGGRKKSGFLKKMTKTARKAFGSGSGSRSYQQRSLELNDESDVENQPEQSISQNAEAGTETPPVNNEAIINEATTEAVVPPEAETSSPNLERRRRGTTNVTEPPNNPDLIPLYFYGDTIVGRNLPGWFRPEMRRRMTGFWPKWSDVPGDVKQDIYNAVFKQYYLFDEKERYRTFSTLISQFGRIYRRIISEMKLKPMKQMKTKNPAELLNHPRPSHLINDNLWHEYVRHWCTKDQLYKSEINTKNRHKMEGPCHGYGRKGVAERLQNMEEQGIPPSMLRLVKEKNQIRDIYGNPTDRVYNKTYQTVAETYEEQYKEMHGTEKDSEMDKTDLEIWIKISDVAQRLKHGSVYCYGNSTNPTTRRNPEEPSSSTAIHRSVRDRVDEYVDEKIKKSKAEQEARDAELALKIQEQQLRDVELALKIQEQELRAAKKAEHAQKLQGTIDEMKAQMLDQRKMIEDFMKKQSHPRRRRRRSTGIVIGDPADDIGDVVPTTQGAPQTQSKSKAPIVEDDYSDDSSA